MELPIHRDLVVLQGATFFVDYEWLEGDFEVPSSLAPVDTKKMKGVLQMRQSHDSTSVLLEVKSEDGEIMFDDEEGTIHVVIPAAKTAKLPWKRNLFYDLKVINTDNYHVFRLAEGMCTVKPEITKVELPEFSTIQL